MKRVGGLLALILCSAALLYAEDAGKSKGTPMTGYLCNSKCVVQSGDKASCSADCNDTSGDTVFVDESGKVMKIANPKKVKGSKMGKKVKAMAKMKDDEMWVYGLQYLY